MLGDCWVHLDVVGIPELRVHPLHLLDEETVAVARLWADCRRAGEMPCGGGRLDQPVKLMAAFAALDAARAALATRREALRGGWR